MDRLARPGGLTSRRNLLIASSVVAFHAAALWALQSGLLRRAVEVIVPVTMLSEIVTPAEPKVEPPPAPRPPEPVARKRPPAPAPAPRPVAQPDPAPSPRAITATAEPSPAPQPPVQAAVPAPAAAPAPPEPPKVQLPSSDADYLQNPKPAYPPISKRLGEQGKVVVRVLIAADGSAQQAEIRQSSGFDRLDQAALQTVLKWRYVPGKRAGVAEAMWFNVPIHFVLE
jgi:protein TonB